MTFDKKSAKLSGCVIIYFKITYEEENNDNI